MSKVTIFNALFATNLIFAPMHVSSVRFDKVGVGLSEDIHCPCNSAEANKIISALEPPTVDTVSLMTESVPCSSIDFSNCTFSNYTWTFCLRTDNDPVSCTEFKHPLKVWFCPGATYYKCHGAWKSFGGCTPCSMSNPAVLPAGCTPPVDPSWTECT